MTAKRIPLLARAGLAALAAAGALSACAPLIVGGAAVGTALVATDRRTSGAQLEDEGIELRAASRLREAFRERAHVSVNSYNRVALLTGEVPSEEVKQQAEQLVSQVPNVRGVINELAVLGNTTLTQRSGDVLITGKVKASLVDAADLQVNAFKVVTERGTVYLMGRVTQREADRATQIARTVSGVQRVVRAFEVISEEELRSEQGALRSQAPASAAR
jgi:osmotically-inducible protein OsmY